MKINIDSIIFRDGLNKVLSVIDKKNSRPILSNCLIKTKTDHLEIVATNLEVTAKIVLPCNSDTEGNFCINTKNVFDIVRELPDANVELNINQDKNLLDLNCKKINYSLLITNSDEYPQTNFENSGQVFKLSSKNISEIITKVSHSISNDETRINLNGIYIQKLDSKLRAVAIDGHRLALLDTHDFNFENQSLVDGIIIPKRAIIELKKISENNIDGELAISVDESFMYINSNDNYFLSIRLIAREYPKYQTVIPSKTTLKMSVDRNLLLNAVKRIRILSNEKTNGIKLGINNNQLTVSANHPSLGHAVEVLPVAYDGNDIEIGFNARYMLDVLSTLDYSETIFEFNNELSPVIVRTEEYPDFLGIIMPLKL
ncbi:MAG: DNA polymerase III subunit beta [Bacteriovoracaceae bacterium]|jgi:DNA polymerase-3 subunit beta|nr:DNA polymerase III subunit beta [Bacteriovoracaceae bacterium]